MEKELRARLAKIPLEFKPTKDDEQTCLLFTTAVLEACHAHIQELHPGWFGDQDVLTTTIEVIRDLK